MNFFLLISIICVCVCETVGISVETAPELSNGWQEIGLADPQSTVQFTVQAKEQNIDRIAKTVLSVSNPSSPHYSQYLSREELDTITAPREEDINVIRTWLQSANTIDIQVSRGRTFKVTMTVANAQQFLATAFLQLVNAKTNQKKIRASTYLLPLKVKQAVRAIFGLHGLPLPPNKRVVSLGKSDAIAEVNPTVIAQTYGINGQVTPKNSSGNVMAVAEFQGETMNPTDLTQFFKQYVKNYNAGTDDVISKFVGDPGTGSAQIEASLDVQYIMSTAVGIPTQFWLYDPQDFCAGLKEWTEKILATPSAPLVFSVSYGWQGDLSQVGCQNAEVTAVDDDFVKIAATGTSIIFASGDSGSGYSGSTTDCTTIEKTTEWVGKAEETKEASSAAACCTDAGASAYTYVGPPGSLDVCLKTPGKVGIELTGTTVFANVSVPDRAYCCALSLDLGRGYNFVKGTGPNPDNLCTVFKTVTGNNKNDGVVSNTNDKKIKGQCTIFSSVSGKKTNANATSGTASEIQLYPSWPASSVWVTSVGATRFINQAPGNPEMATDQFGSGGGFSAMFNQTDNGTWQMTAVATYLQNVNHTKPFPPDGSFPPLGRATPDVAALGEGYDVINEGQLNPGVAGTSCATPVFAAVISLINEARLQAGKKQLGFLNQFVYKNPAIFNDVTVGSNAFGRGTGTLPYGYPCIAGWDPATGLGTPKFPDMLKAGMALP